MKSLIVGAAILCGGCTSLGALVPNSVSPEYTHVSHALQHSAITSASGVATHYGVDVLSVVAEWDVGKHLYLSVSEGVNIGTQQRYKDGELETGGLMGGREVFTGRVGWKFITRP